MIFGTDHKNTTEDLFTGHRLEKRDGLDEPILKQFFVLEDVLINTVLSYDSRKTFCRVVDSTKIVEFPQKPPTILSALRSTHFLDYCVPPTGGRSFERDGDDVPARPFAWSSPPPVGGAQKVVVLTLRFTFLPINLERSLLTFCLSGGTSPRLSVCHASPFLGKGPPPRHSITVTPNANTSAFGSSEFSSSSSNPSSWES
nr:unnamed protein product [Callosobruchus chinensis]